MATVSNYTIMRDQMRGEFVKYDQDKMIRKFSLKHDEDYLYIEFVKKDFRINRHNGVVEWTDDGFQTAAEAGYNESMTIYDVLCYSKDDCHLAGSFCPANMLRGTVKTANVGRSMFKKNAEEFDGRTEALAYACSVLGEPSRMSGDVAAILYPFSFLPITIQYWEADDEFPSNIKFMFDENVVDYMHYETTYFMLGHVIKRMKQIMDQYDLEKKNQK